MKEAGVDLWLLKAGDWLNVVPSQVLGLQLRGQEFRIAVLYRLGAPVFSSEGPCLACGAPSDRLGDHAVGCASRGGRIVKHNHLQDALFNTEASTQLAPLREANSRPLTSSFLILQRACTWPLTLW